jgi:hypothetical protein
VRKPIIFLYGLYNVVVSMQSTQSSIRLSEDTKKRLEKIGKMHETYEDVILKLLAYYEKEENE